MSNTDTPAFLVGKIENALQEAFVDRYFSAEHVTGLARQLESIAIGHHCAEIERLTQQVARRTMERDEAAARAEKAEEALRAEEDKAETVKQLEKRNAELYDDLKDSKASWLEREHNLVRKLDQLRAEHQADLAKLSEQLEAMTQLRTQKLLEENHRLCDDLEKTQERLTRTRGIVVSLVADWMEAKV